MICYRHIGLILYGLPCLECINGYDGFRFSHIVNMNLAISPVVGGGRYATHATVMQGTRAEQRFADICEARGLRIRMATKYENMVRHFDFVVTLKTGETRKIDVKAIKAPKRGERPDADILFVETRGVSGRTGWVFGDADLIAFEQPKGFFMVPRQALVKRVQRLMPICKRSSISGVPMTIYGRRGRKDEVVVLSFKHIAGMEGSFFLGK
jgi:hypothetical protein